MGPSKLDVVGARARTSVVPFEWEGLGAVFAGEGDSGQVLDGKLSFVLRSGYDALGQVPLGKVLIGNADLGGGVRLKDLAVYLSLGNAAYKSGIDDPASAQSVAEATAPSLKATVAKKLGEDSVLAASWDFKQRAPALSLCLTGRTQLEKAALLVQLDPVRQRSLKVAAAVSFPGPDWRSSRYDYVARRYVHPEDYGQRHHLYVRHELRLGDLFSSSQIGCRVDVSRALNLLAGTVYNEVIPRLPRFQAPFWLSRHGVSKWVHRNVLQRGRDILLPPPGPITGYHYRFANVELDACHDVVSGCQEVALMRHTRLGSFGLRYGGGPQREVGIKLVGAALELGVNLGKIDEGEGSSWREGWRKPSFSLQVRPLALL